MNPEVPIALRMSGHLLLGVVRIYSKQVDYFFEECNEIRITINRVFTTVTVNLPNDATQAPFQSVTLPQKFDLDAMELDDYIKDWYVIDETIFRISVASHIHRLAHGFAFSGMKILILRTRMR